MTRKSDFRATGLGSFRRRSSLLATAIGALGIVPLAMAGSVPAAAAPAADTATSSAAVISSGLPDLGPDWTTLFSDDFDGASGTGLNRSNWLYDIGRGYPGGADAWGTGEIETMTDSTQNVYQDGSGNLAIKPIRDSEGNWTSGRIETQRTDFQSPAGGVLRVEASIKQPDVSGAEAQGYWPAFWMLGEPARGTGASGWPGIGEIDILESVNGESASYATMHCGVAPDGPCDEFTGLTSGRHDIPGASKNFHTYAVEWDRSGESEKIRWYADDENYFTIDESRVDATTWKNATDHGYFPILNVAIGGGWPGLPTEATTSGVPMLVDYVQVSSRGGSTPNPDPEPNPGAGSGSAITGLADKCVDVAGSNSTDRTQVQLYTCNGTSAQKWVIGGDDTVRAFGKCLDVRSSGTADGTPVQLYTCNGTEAQNWGFSSAGDIVSILADKCLDVTDASEANRTPLQIATCSGKPNQKWEW